MKTSLCVMVGGLLAVAGTAVPSRAAIQGDYVEARSADVYTGPCFANSQVELEGKQAILGWKVERGDWKGVELGGLSVVAVVKARATLGDPDHDPYPAESVLIVDQRANAQQRAALEALAKSMAGRLLDHVVRVETAPIRMEVGQGAEHGSVRLVAGGLAKVKTRHLAAADVICGNEKTYYPPLIRVTHAMPAYSDEDAFHGHGLGVEWTRLGARSAFVGSFRL